MFEETLRKLAELDGKPLTISVAIDADADGYIDKECPAENCEYVFKVNAEDKSSIVFGNTMFCPQCRHEAASDRWHTKEQIEHAKTMAMNKLKNEINSGFEADARAFNRQQPRHSFIKMSLSFSGHSRHPVSLPAPAADALRLQIGCDTCGARFAVVGTAFFCPACGRNQIERVFDDAMKKIRAKAQPGLKTEAALVEELGKDEAALVVRSMIEGGLQDVVTSFQSFATEHYRRRFPSLPLPPRNIFQRLDDGSALWKAATGSGYDRWLDAAELARLRLHLQRRHVLAHGDGIVDQEYVTKTADPLYKVGQRLVVPAADVNDAVALVEKLVAGLRQP